jgi:hypothetical protein
MTDYLLWLLDEEAEENEEAMPLEVGVSRQTKPLGKKPRRLRLQKGEGIHGEIEDTALPHTLEFAKKTRLFYFLGKQRGKEPVVSIPFTEEKRGQTPLILPQEVSVQGPGAEVRVSHAEQAEAAAFLTKLQTKRSIARYAQQQGGRAAITLPETPQTDGAPPDLLAIDRGFQRDARRYDGGFSLY